VARYGRTYKRRVAARLPPPESASVDVVREIGVGVKTLERWRAVVLADASSDAGAAAAERWTATTRLEAAIDAAMMAAATCSPWCRGNGVYDAELNAWKRDVISCTGEPCGAGAAEPRQYRRRITELQRAFQFKEKARDETAALLVLSKKTATVFHKGKGA
jgi:hypothetical protein